MRKLLQTITYILFSFYSLAQSTPGFEQDIASIEESIDKFQNEGKFEACIPLYQKLQAIYARQSNWEAYVNQFCFIGMSNWQAGNYQAMGTYLDSALLVAKRENIDKKSDTYATIWSYSGFYYGSIGDGEKALEAFQKTLEIDKHLYTTQKSDFDTTYLAYDYISLGAWFNTRGDYAEAVRYFYQALPYLPANHIEKVTAYNNIGWAYSRKKDYERARTTYHQALKTLRTYPDGFEKTDKYLLIYNNLASLFCASEEPDSSYFYLKKLQAIIPPHQKTDLADYYQILGDTDVLVGKFRSAEKNRMAALRLRQKVFGNVHPTIAISLRTIGELLAKQKKHIQALKYYQKALTAISTSFSDSLNYQSNPDIDKPINNRIELLKILHEKADALRELGKYATAQSTLQLAIQLIDQIRFNYLADGSKYALLERAMPIYEQSIDLAIELNDKKWAFEVLERSKATLLLESIKNSAAQSFAGIPEDILQQEQEQKITIAFYERLLNEAEDEEQQQVYRRTLFELRRTYQNFLVNLEQQYSDYYNLKYNVKYPTIKEVQSQLLTTNTALLEYFTGDSILYIFTVTKEAFQILKLPKAKDFETQVNAFRQSLATPAMNQNNFSNYVENAWSIYDSYLRPALQHLPNHIEQLILIPDGQLSYLPFQTLIQHPVDKSTITEARFDTLSYLIYNYAISYAYSSNLLLSMTASKVNTSEDVGAFAPVFSEQYTSEVRSAALKELIYSRQEVEEIHALWKSINYIESAASLQNFKNDAHLFRILHLSTHATVNDQSPSKSKIHFADDYLTVNEIYNLPIEAELVVLSACETGTGEFQKGEGILSMARAFMYAGCPSLVTSLWQVNDESTTNLMVEFYRQLQVHQTKSKALQAAQIHYLQNSSSIQAKHPFYWAAFIQIGDPTPFYAFNKWQWTIVGIGIIIALFFLFFWLRKK